MNNSDWVKLRGLLLEKTDAGLLKWEQNSRGLYFECSLGEGLNGRSSMTEFLLVDKDGETVA